MTTVTIARRPVHEAQAFRPRANRLGLWLFLASESFLFSAAITARFALVGQDRPEQLNQGLGLVITGVLLLSSLSAYSAETAIRHGDSRGLVRNLAATIGLGMVFMVGVTIEWREGLEFFPPSTPFGSAFFTLIGLHAFHVTTGLVALGIVLHLARRGRFDARDHWGVEGTVKYWHFVDVAWVFIYPTLYLVGG